MPAGVFVKVEYLVIRDTVKDRLSVIFVPIGYRPGPSKGWTWGGPFRTSKDAYQAVGRDDGPLHAQLYPEKAAANPGTAAGSLS